MSIKLNENAEALMKKINKREAVVGVVGLGYVGLPLAVEKAKAGYKVIGFDVQAERVDAVNNGENYIGDVVDSELAEIVESGQLSATADYDFMGEVDAVAICVPTPLDIYKQPNTSYVEASSKDIAKRLHEGMLVVLESTTYPGTTEELIRPTLEESGLEVGKDFFLAYSPERVDPGNKDFNTKNTPKVVGGVTEQCTEVAAALYGSVLESDVHRVSSPAVAEMEKILENTFRNINIALANEMAILSNKMGIDVWEVIDAAATKPYGFMPFYPGPGLGGHCIPIDPWYLSWKAREYNYHTRLIEVAGEINNDMPDYVIKRVMEILNEDGKALKGAKVLILGVAYKKDIDDYRESPIFPIMDKLQLNGADWKAVDPHIPEFEYLGQKVQAETVLDLELLNSADIIVIGTNHTAFDYELILESDTPVFDTRNSYKEKVLKEKYYKL